MLQQEERYLIYADDDEDDKAILIEMMRRIEPSINIITKENGLQVIKFLGNMESREGLPSCIVLDMNMPVMDGMQTLKEIKKSPLYRNIPVFLFSTSNNPDDIAMASQLGAVAFVTKPYGQKELLEVCEEFADYCRRDINLIKNPPPGERSIFN